MDIFENMPDLLRMIVTLAVVVALMGGLAMLLKRLGLSGALPTQAGSKRLQVVERLTLDTRRQLVLLKRDNKEHLVILSAQGETVLESDIKAPVKKAVATDKKDIKT